MARGQRRGNRESMKPTQNKPKKTGSAPSKVAETFQAKPAAKAGRGGKS